MDNELVYVETSVISHAAARRSRDPEVFVLQDQAKRWLSEIGPDYRLVTSQTVIDEASRGDEAAAAERLALLKSIPMLPPDPDIEVVAGELLSRSLMPANAQIDAVHGAAAALGGVQYLLTQNCRHIANATVLPDVYRLLQDMGLEGLLICTPAEFLGDPSLGDSDDAP